MSSILDALRKAEQEAAADGVSGAPWHGLVRLQSPRRQFGRRWWPLLGVILVCSVFAAVLWLRHAPDRPAPATFETAASVPHIPHERAEPQMPQPTVSATEKKPPQSTDRTAQTIVDTPPVPQKTQPPPVVAKIEPVIAPPMVTNHEDQTEAMRQPNPATASDQAVRSDPRITLQALVWAPDAADRFVVINNRLIKEGGSVDTIVVVQIDRDAVLLSEGADRWHQPFRLR